MIRNMFQVIAQLAGLLTMLTPIILCFAPFSSDMYAFLHCTLILGVTSFFVCIGIVFFDSLIS